MTDIVYRPRSVTEILDASFQLIRQNYSEFVTVTAVSYLPLAAISFFVTRWFGYDVAPELFQFRPGILLLLALQVVWFCIVSALVTIVASQAYLQQPVDTSAAWKIVLARAASIIGSTLMVYLMAGIGFILLFIPGIYLYSRLGLAPTIATIEGNAAQVSLGRSSALSVGRKWHILLVSLLALVIFFVVIIGMSIVAEMLPSTILSSALSAVVTVLTWPLIPVVQTVLYYDLRIRGEGYDVELMSQQLGDLSTESAL